ncbi:MAG: apolipoprotein acyltransferase [Pseudomonadota bacterium]|jgi:hypothetical protein|nr:apolipoprotein acyltransferase [Pseudomonadota bacterium]MEC8796639.1 apolipoprotein acyltransferase [Pseudomonadota bacterium]
MIVIAGLIIGLVFGFIQGKRRKGTGFDIAHNMAVYAIAFALLGMVLTVIIDRSIG